MRRESDSGGIGLTGGMHAQRGGGGVGGGGRGGGGLGALRLQGLDGRDGGIREEERCIPNRSGHKHTPVCPPGGEVCKEQQHHHQLGRTGR